MFYLHWWKKKCAAINLTHLSIKMESTSQVWRIKRQIDHLCKCRGSDSFLLWSIQVCVITMWRRNNTSTDLRESLVAVYEVRKGVRLFIIILQKEQLLTSGKHSRRISPQFQTVQKPRATSQSPEAWVSMLNVKVANSTVRKRRGGLLGKSLVSAKNTLQ